MKWKEDNGIDDITRDDFEKGIQELLVNIDSLIEKASKALSADAHVDRIELIGGQNFIPLFRQHIKSILSNYPSFISFHFILFFLIILHELP